MCAYRWTLPHITVASGMLLCQRRRKTWQCFGGKWRGVKGHPLSLSRERSDAVMTEGSVLPCCSHVMNELLETERAYVEELLCVLEVSVGHHKGRLACKSVPCDAFQYSSPGICG